MIQLVYASAATQPFTSADLSLLLTKSRARNSLYKVSGLLLYDSGSFLQVLEGEERSVDLILSSIERDPRHRNTRIHHREKVQRPEFSDWAMGFLDTSSMMQNTPGLIDYRRALPKLTQQATDARRFLRFFHEGLCRQR